MFGDDGVERVGVVLFVQPRRPRAIAQTVGTTCRPSEIEIAIEIAHSSLLIDRNEKGRIYAIAGVPVYWVINVVDRFIEVYTELNPSASHPFTRFERTTNPATGFRSASS